MMKVNTDLFEFFTFYTWSFYLCDESLSSRSSRVISRFSSNTICPFIFSVIRTFIACYLFWMSFDPLFR